jgi:Rod binding domain-containing protein
MSTINTSFNPSSLNVLTRPKSIAQIQSGINAPDGVSVDSKRAEARTAAEGLVATSFIKPILAQVRESNHAPPPFGPTQAEKQFGSLLDNQLADEITRAAQFPIVDRLVAEFTKHLPTTDSNPQQQPQGIDLSA